MLSMKRRRQKMQRGQLLPNNTGTKGGPTSEGCGIRLYSPLEPFFTKPWRPSEIELVK